MRQGFRTGWPSESFIPKAQPSHRASSKLNSLMNRVTWGWAHPMDPFGHSNDTLPPPFRTALATVTKVEKSCIDSFRQAASLRA